MVQDDFQIVQNASQIDPDNYQIVRYTLFLSFENFTNYHIPWWWKIVVPELPTTKMYIKVVPFSTFVGVGGREIRSKKRVNAMIFL